MIEQALDYFQGYIGFVIAGITVVIGLGIVGAKVLYDRRKQTNTGTTLASFVDSQKLDGFDPPQKPQ